MSTLLNHNCHENWHDLPARRMQMATLEWLNTSVSLASVHCRLMMLQQQEGQERRQRERTSHHLGLARPQASSVIQTNNLCESSPSIQTQYSTWALCFLLGALWISIITCFICHSKASARSRLLPFAWAVKIFERKIEISLAPGSCLTRMLLFLLHFQN